jgi:hypothetical protein
MGGAVGNAARGVAWERLGWTRTVARYCRVMVRGEPVRVGGDPRAGVGARGPARADAESDAFV